MTRILTKTPCLLSTCKFKISLPTTIPFFQVAALSFSFIKILGFPLYGRQRVRNDSLPCSCCHCHASPSCSSETAGLFSSEPDRSALPSDAWQNPHPFPVKSLLRSHPSKEAHLIILLKIIIRSMPPSWISLILLCLICLPGHLSFLNYSIT